MLLARLAGFGLALAAFGLAASAASWVAAGGGDAGPAPARAELETAAIAVVGETTEPTATPREDPDDQKGVDRLAHAAHAQAASIDKLPRFSYRVRYRHGVVDSMRAVDASIDRLKQSLTAPVVEGDWLGWYETSFAWDEQRFLWEMRPGDTSLNFAARFWTRTDAWERREANDRSSVNFVRSAGPSKFWKGLILFDYGYLRLTPHRYWWGQTAEKNSQTMSPIPTENVSWRHLGIEKLGEETCDIVDSPGRTERLWIGRNSRRVQGVLTYYVAEEAISQTEFYKSDPIRQIAGKAFDTQRDYARWRREEASEQQLIRVSIAYAGLRSGSDPSKIRPNEFVQFDDYREVSPAVWLPFREVRAFPHASEIVQGKRQLIRSELRVEEVKTDQDLGDRFARLLPKEGDQVQDQRYIVPVDVRYGAERDAAEIRKLAKAQYNKSLEGEAILKVLARPIADLVSKPAPKLADGDWIGVRPADLTGKPYLLHFWATWCGPCKGDLPRLKTLARSGVVILGMHPAGTAPDEVEKVIRDQQLNYPTFLAKTKDGDPNIGRIGGYPAGIFPYCILVDAQGRVAGHGSLSELLDKFGPGAMRSPKDGGAGKE